MYMRFPILIISLFLTQTIAGQNIPVDPMIGTGGHGHTFPGATLPFGMVQISPDTRTDGSWDGCSGYHYSDSVIYGFSHTHLSGTGVSDYGDIALMPGNGNPEMDSKINAGVFNHSDEQAEAGYYSVFLRNKQIKAEFTATTRTAIHSYSFSKPGLVNVVLDLQHRDPLIDFTIKSISRTRIEGYRQSKAWAENQLVYFVIEFSEPIIKTKYNADKSKAGFTFIMTNKSPLLVKVGISFTSQAGAISNLLAENPGWDFQQIKSNARATWQNELGKINAEFHNTEDSVKFYTALYHCMIHPNVASDINGEYRGMDFKTHTAVGYTRYTVFSLWDTYRALHPLLSIIDKKRTRDFIVSFLEMYKESGRLPVWELAGNETNCMIGYHAVSVIADAYSKGITDFDTELALSAMTATANSHLFGLPVYIKQGFIPAEAEPESVSKTLEYAYNDWCIGTFATALGKESIAKEYFKRSQAWKQLFNPATGFMTPRFQGNWINHFDPREVNNHFTEGNSWQYSFYVPQDIIGFINIHGGSEKAAAKIDGLFGAPQKTTGREQADITGLIGQYAHGNEPSHHIAYLYNYVFMPEKTQKIIRKICDSFYTTHPDGLIGNEDCGQMSAWYVLNSLGIYPPTPAFPYYAIGIPNIKNATVNLENGTQWKIETKNSQLPYATPYLNGEVVHFLPHSAIENGETLKFDFSQNPSEIRTDYLLPPMQIFENETVFTPLVIGDKIFNTTTTFSIQTHDKDVRLFYYILPDTQKAILYSGPVKINNSTTIRAFAIREQGIETIKSNVNEVYFHKIPNNWVTSTNVSANNQYSCNGPNSLTDGIYGTTNWRAGQWMGYQGQDVEIVIDLQQNTSIRQISSSCLQDTRSWIVMPKKSEVSFSMDGTNFTSVGEAISKTKPDDYNVQKQLLTVELKTPKTARYVKIKLKTFGNLPEWHQGYPFGAEAFIFIDEVLIK